MKLGI